MGCFLFVRNLRFEARLYSAKLGAVRFGSARLGSATAAILFIWRALSSTQLAGGWLLAARSEALWAPAWPPAHLAVGGWRRVRLSLAAAGRILYSLAGRPSDILISRSLRVKGRTRRTVAKPERLAKSLCLWLFRLRSGLNGCLLTSCSCLMLLVAGCSRGKQRADRAAAGD